MGLRCIMSDTPSLCLRDTHKPTTSKYFSQEYRRLASFSHCIRTGGVWAVQRLAPLYIEPENSLARHPHRGVQWPAQNSTCVG